MIIARLSSSIHIPVMVEQVSRILLSGSVEHHTKTFLDMTYGRGGHTRALLNVGATVFSVDRDEAAYAHCIELQKTQFQERLIAINASFSQLPSAINKVSFNCARL
ncbi:hypothetical protein ACOME3_000335 [Neoechinorhynchus agilis]